MLPDPDFNGSKDRKDNPLDYSKHTDALAGQEESKLAHEGRQPAGRIKNQDAYEFEPCAYDMPQRCVCHMCNEIGAIEGGQPTPKERASG